jgi:hypothetical protein
MHHNQAAQLDFELILAARGRRSIDPAALREKLGYDPETGIFTWKDSASNVRANGSVAGTTRPVDGYIQINVLGHINLAHRLAWLYVHGEWPRGNIDHINGIPDDNRIANLRDVTQALNAQNQRRAQRRSKTGILGVSPYKGRFRATITVGRKQRALGYFDTAEAAQAAYVAAKRLYHPAGML